METAPVLTDVDGRIGWITLNRPEAMNAITVALAEGLDRALAELEGACDVVVIRGAGDHFCAGGDFKELQALRIAEATAPGSVARLFDAFGAACARVAALEVPVVVAVHGYAMAGGFELMQAADIAIVARDAKLADNHSNYGQVPGGGGTQYLPRLVGRARAGAHILLGERLSGEDAVAWGLAWRAVDATDLADASTALAQRLAGKSRPAQARVKRLIRDGLERPLADGLARERAEVVDYLGSEDGARAMAAFAPAGAR